MIQSRAAEAERSAPLVLRVGQVGLHPPVAHVNIRRLEPARTKVAELVREPRGREDDLPSFRDELLLAHLKRANVPDVLKPSWPW